MNHNKAPKFWLKLIPSWNNENEIANEGFAVYLGIAYNSKSKNEELENQELLL